MNSLRAPLIALAVAVVALGAWLVWAHQNAASAVQQAQVATSTLSTSVIQPAATTSLPTTPTAVGLDPTTVVQDIVGSWLSTDLPGYSVSATASGKWTDSYTGANATTSTSETGTYEIFTTQDPDKDFTGVLVPGVVYLKVAEGKSIAYFSVATSTDTQLELNYLDKGATLSFVKQ